MYTARSITLIRHRRFAKVSFAYVREANYVLIAEEQFSRANRGRGKERKRKEDSVSVRGR